ncbi:DUF3280 domain-containing protein [Methylocystis bryophila]|uniref:DUF2380 domain-containing protein n=1 Tax=Methylocystis bryophila TaxID=655015 RepID=A0A1W6MRJ4_9HYPH|nr:DUF3280 domain-containing protein [Methylocystis bryophila]ARN80218.1 hypothetical protein B1812_02985 [Methylocystis bryophila]BDV40174.1 hypothetical protein DSM21852_34270 [Methylocystis bryophila]
MQRQLQILAWRVAALSLLALAPILASRSQAQDAPAPPPKLAAFDLELDDFSAGGPLAGETPEETQRLSRMSALARRLLSESGLFRLVETGGAPDSRVKDHWLRKCDGCDADIARALGADLSFIGYFRKISRMEQFLEIRVRNARTGELLNVSHTDLRNETDESWSRALTHLIKRRLVEPELARRDSTPAR